MRTLSRISRFCGAWALGMMFLFGVGQVASAAAAKPAILVLGDSLSAGYGLRPGQGWVTLLQKRLQSQGYEYQVVNASVSGETSTGGLQRLPRALELHKPALVVLELGANDGLRGVPLASTRINLTRIIESARDAGAAVLLLGMRIPPNYGPRYASDFMALYADLAKRYDLAFVPFFLEKVALNEKLMQEDGLHPNAQAQPLLLESVWPGLAPLLKK